MVDVEPLRDIQGEIHKLAHRLEQFAETDGLPIIIRENILRTSKALMVPSATISMVIKYLSKSEETEDDPRGCIPNERIDKAYEDAISEQSE